ncbi:prolipoprotein diacylglyceryl transferase 2 [Schaalia cardiffensis F0333]|uniref:Phosphatidylglycerol--prolipoprotein diacylglyceryl transferase n=1 Tax=Schaalia cardiffensis F0333 TaxID=888050 RepID=N6WBF1_9ACTO|nr:prolipoprotein diacylglyceryl transferase [Schaalia cardiffensis]ENO17559.1 prolipoprotein diacylglyceryl transferase 2 [Schaalia cardiffensis F0333]
MFVASLPSPPQGVWYLGPIPLRAYGIIIVTGMILALWWTGKRYARRGGDPELMYDIALWAIPLGIIGARLYHVVTTPYGYFSPGSDPWAILRIWEGGLAIWGGVTFGALGVFIAVKRKGQRLGPIADSVAPALIMAQGIGRWGNYFNQELFGSATTLPWGLEIDDRHLPAGYASGTLFHPTFLYESMWNLTMAALIAWADRRFRFKSGQVFSLYLIAYPIGRIWMETMRLDEARSFLGIRLNAWTSIGMLVLALVIFVVAARLNRSTCLVGDERYVAEESLKAADGDAGADSEANADGASGADATDSLGADTCGELETDTDDPSRADTGVEAAGGSVLESDASVDLESDTSSDSQADAETRR